MNSLRSRAFGWLIAVSLGCLAAPTHASAQAGTGRLSGTAVDEQGAAVTTPPRQIGITLWLDF